MIIFSYPLHELLAPWLKIFERKQRPHKEMEQGVELDDGISEIILIGMGRYGSSIAQALRERGCGVLSVDYNPPVLIRSGDSMGYPVRYGDAEDPEFIASLPLAH